MPGASIAIIDNYQVVWAKGFGVREVGSNDSVDERTLFQTVSISKMFLALTALKMVQDGQIKLDEDVDTKVVNWKVPQNEFNKTEKVTLRRLLSHTAGINVYSYIRYDKGNGLPTTLQVLSGDAPADNLPITVYVKPGQMFSYSCGGYSIVKQLLNDVSEIPFTLGVKSNVFDPLNLNRSTYEQPDENLTNYAAGHIKGRVLEGKFKRFSGYNGL